MGLLRERNNNRVSDELEYQSEIIEIKTDLTIDNFTDLGPIDCIGYSVYDSALEFALSNAKVTNVAITGGYGSGKTSFINSFKKRDEENQWIDISLSQFEKNHDDSIQRAIINQIIYKIDKDDIIRSKLISNKGSILEDKCLIITSSLLLITLLYFNNIILLQSIFSPLIKSWNIVLFELIVYTRIHLLLPTAVFLVTLFLFIYKLIALFEQHKFKFSLSFLGGSMEGGSQDTKDSYIDDNLKEIVYVLENTTANVFVFQDLDRLSEKMILSKLRELSQLINRGDKKPLKFLYLLRDDVFLTEEFTKFFDFTIPILPHLDSNNSYDRLFTEIKKLIGTDLLISRRFMKSVSPYITNSRMLKNISNDYIIYKNKLNIDSNEIQNLYGVMILKNILPLEVRELMTSKGILFIIIDSKSSLISRLEEVIPNDTINNDKRRLSLMDLISLFNQQRQDFEKDWISDIIDTYITEQTLESRELRNFEVIQESTNLLRYFFESGIITEFNYLRLLSDTTDSVLSPRDRLFVDNQFYPESLGYNYRLDNALEVVNEMYFDDIGSNSLNVDFLNAIIMNDKMIKKMRNIILDNNQVDILLEKELDINVTKALLGFKSFPDLTLLIRLLEKKLEQDTISLFIHFSLLPMLTLEFDDKIKVLIEKHCTIDSMLEFLTLREISQFCVDNQIRLENLVSESPDLLNMIDNKLFLDTVGNIPFIFSVYNFNVVVSMIKQDTEVEFCDEGIELIADLESGVIFDNLTKHIIDFTADLKKHNLKLNDNSEVQTKLMNTMSNVEEVRSYLDIQISNELINLIEIDEEIIKNELAVVSGFKKNWENYFYIFDSLDININIIESINQNSEKCIFDKYDLYSIDSDNTNIEKFLMFLTKSLDLKNDVYKSVIKELSKTIKLIKDDEFDISKIEILITEEKLVFDEISMNIIISKYSELSYSFIYRNLPEFFEFAEFDLPEKTIKEILLSTDLTIQQKELVISRNKNLISLKDNKYSFDVIEFVLHNKFSLSDLNFLIKYFDSVPDLHDKNLSKLISLIHDNFEEFCKENYNLVNSKIGLMYLIQSISKDAENTIFLLDKFEEKIFSRVVKRVSQNRPLVKKTERNWLICQKLFSVGLTYKPALENRKNLMRIRLRPLKKEPL